MAAARFRCTTAGNRKHAQNSQDENAVPTPTSLCLETQESFGSSGRTGEFSAHQPLQFGPVFFKILEKFLERQLGVKGGDLVLIHAGEIQQAHGVVGQGGGGGLAGLGDDAPVVEGICWSRRCSLT